MGENQTNDKLNGFTWKDGRTPDTNGILMWSEIFTHDYENGNKVAIILLDTQGTFDSQSSMYDCTTIFALSTMLSSVQCFNVMRQININDLQNLQLFTDYAQLAANGNSETPFQHLIIIVRDWPYADEIDYGFIGQKLIDETLAEKDEQTPEMRQLRKILKLSFSKISSFLLPHPGQIVAQERRFTGNLSEISPEFKQYLKLLIPSILSPEKLVLKQINGDNVRARELVQYIRAYNTVFNNGELPKAEDILTVFKFIDFVECYLECQLLLLLFIILLGYSKGTTIWIIYRCYELLLEQNERCACIHEFTYTEY